MTKKLCIGSAWFIFSMLCLTVYHKLVIIPEQIATYRLSPISIFVGYFGTQLLYVCAGLISTIMIRKCYPRVALPRIFTWLGLLMIISYVLMNVIYLSLPSSQDTLYLSFRNVLHPFWLYPQLLTVSGIFTGLGVSMDQKADMLQQRSKVMIPVILLLLCILYEVVFQYNVTYHDPFTIPHLPFLIQIRGFFVHPLFYISLGTLIMDGLFTYWVCPSHLSWFRWICAGLLGLLLLYGVCYMMQIVWVQSMVRVYEVSEVFTLIGVLFGLGIHSSQKVC